MRVRPLRAIVAALSATAIAIAPAQPAHADRIRDDQWHLRYLKVAEAHRISQGEGVTVAVIDTGVDPHPDLRGNVLSGTDVVTGGTGDGRQDHSGHGTGMAGLIAAHGRGSGKGALGIAPKTKILPIRQKVREGPGDPDNVAAGIEWALARGARVISISLGGSPSTRLRIAVETAIKADVVVISAAGNLPPNLGVVFPASYDGVVAVGATDRNGKRAEISVTGKKLTITAPGVDIYSTSIDGKYRKGTGTSNATAIVAGAAALVRSRYPHLSAEEVVHRLTATAVDKGAPGHDKEFGHGVLDLVAALTADVPPLHTAAPSASASPSPTTTDAAAPPAEPSANRGRTWGLPLVGIVVLVVAGLLGIAVLARHHRRDSG